MDKFLEMHNLLKLTQKEIVNLNRTITSEENDTVLKKLSTTATQKAQDHIARQGGGEEERKGGRGRGKKYYNPKDL